MNKQIEEMANVICESCGIEHCAFLNKGKLCPQVLKDAKALYDMDYRKQIEGEWIYRFSLEGDKFYDCSVCGRQVIINVLCNQERDASDFYPYCHCGAKMKGESK